MTQPNSNKILKFPEKSERKMLTEHRLTKNYYPMFRIFLLYSFIAKVESVSLRSVSRYVRETWGMGIDGGWSAMAEGLQYSTPELREYCTTGR